MFTLRFPILIIDEDFNEKTIASHFMRLLADSLEKKGYIVRAGYNLEDIMHAPIIFTDLSCIIISIGAISKEIHLRMDVIREILLNAHSRSPYMPVYLCGERQIADKLPLDIMRKIHGYIFIFEDTISFIAGHVDKDISEYYNNLLPPFFKKLIEFTAEAKYSWHTPGHSGGVAYTKTPVGRAFLQFFGERLFRSDLSVSVSELGSLLEHNGPIGTAERAAAKIFGADYTFFVTNGTSTANKIVWHALVAPNDLVLVDRNCHKSLINVITMIGAIPIYFTPLRNEVGIIGPIDEIQFTKEFIEQKINNHPLVTDKNKKIRIAVITNSTYDGICYNSSYIKEKLDGIVDYLHFDEAWFGYGKFHEFYNKRFAMCGGKKENITTILCTQSTHKLLAALSQSAMIHIKEGNKSLDKDRFNEAFMMHSSTSPLYSIIASCDVAAKMMEETSGRTLVQETLDESLSFRQEMQKIGREIKNSNGWWFNIWAPEKFIAAEPDIDENLSVYGYYIHNPKDWTLESNAKWHGFGKMSFGYAMLDPIKITLLCPGQKADGTLESDGIPAVVVTKYLEERGIIVEKTGLFNFLILFSLGISKTKWNNIIIELLFFKDAYDKNISLENVLPKLCAQDPDCYNSLGLKDLCSQLHKEYKIYNVAHMINDIYTILPEPVLTPQSSYAKFVHGNVEEVSLGNLMGRISAVMIVPYPPGIPLIMPGERFTSATHSIIDYLKFCEHFDAKNPGFEVEVQGIRSRKNKLSKRNYKVDCIIEN